MRHDYHFILETDDAIIREHLRPWNWFRWLAAGRYLHFYDYLLIVDPDQFVVPECWNISVASVVGDSLPDIAMRDVGPPQTLNNGVVFLRNSARGRFFLDLLLGKIGWSQTIQHDQGAFDETVLEALGYEASTSLSYDSHCMPFLFPNEEGHSLIALYAMCWWNEAQRLTGKAGERSSQMILFVNPKELDMNHVVGYRLTTIPAFLYHFAGPGKDWHSMLTLFGMARRHTADCMRVFKHVDEVGGQKVCIPGNRGVEDMFSYCEPPLAVC